MLLVGELALGIVLTRRVLRLVELLRRISLIELRGLYQKWLSVSEFIVRYILLYFAKAATQGDTTNEADDKSNDYCCCCLLCRRLSVQVCLFLIVRVVIVVIGV